MNSYSLRIKFNVIGKKESQLKLNLQPNISYKVHKDLKIYEAQKLESIFIETINKNRKNCIIGCIYKHPHCL